MFPIGPQRGVIARVLEQEGVVAAGRVDLEVGDDAPVVEQRAHDLARARRREAPVGLERDHEERGLGARERLGEVAAEVGRGSK